MIKEFALNPDVLCEWPAFRHVAQGLGFFHGRVFARYPKDWRKRAYARALAMDQNSRKKIETWLADVAPQAMVDSRRGFTFDGQRPWFDNALTAHTQKPFHAIISDQADTNNPPILNIADVDQSKPLWNIPKQSYVSRQATALGSVVVHCWRTREIFESSIRTLSLTPTRSKCWLNASMPRMVPASYQPFVQSNSMSAGRMSKVAQSHTFRARSLGNGLLQYRPRRLCDGGRIISTIG